jgi:site-specific recombinase XerD
VRRLQIVSVEVQIFDVQPSLRTLASIVCHRSTHCSVLKVYKSLSPCEYARWVQREQEPKSPFVFTSERGAPFATAGFARMVERAGAEARFAFKAHPHMLRHACGYALANKGHDTRALQAYLGHRNIQHTVRYTELSPTRFKNFWRS